MDRNTVNLGLNDTGVDVVDVQLLLQDRNLYNGVIDGSYGEMTKNSVIQLQLKLGVQATGVFDSKTANALFLNSLDISNTSKFLLLNTFKDMKKRTDTYIIAHNGKAPLIVYITPEKFEHVNYGKYQDILKRYVSYCKLHGKEPLGCYVNRAKEGSYPAITDNTNRPICNRLEKLTHTKITNYKSLYHAFTYFIYSYYYNDIYPRAIALKRLAEGKGLNCTDFAQLFYYAAKELGIKVRIIRGYCRCNNGKWYGHVWCQIYVNGGWINADPSGAARHHRPLNVLICTNGFKITNIDPAWAISDDGRT